ncbi:Hypothetical protein IALB_0868 [Ignavibacterium album JCM 16511]|uniref:Heavy metal binding domain-containing protein n=1 Tax=Ignavibacterium album (strain DSM 19864 / JCM 16511 / NBRC 101810 / Mat9-16) TaxID=945713 RepID=I0AHX3_IGNAJ|nr:heavy metal-binding domain-containing protein [Ignavibacterium album]AFH48580.1 Hypothetical protein IALB_0868 [Ignavibacterium album JCM 16511]
MLKQLAFTIALFSFFGVFTLAQEKTEAEKKECSKRCCSGPKTYGALQMSYIDADSTHKHDQKKSESEMHGMHHKMKLDSTKVSSIVRNGEIDLAAIDENKDGKVYQDQMCWNVISDKPGECPQCGMILKEVTVEKAKENLLKHNFKVK